MRRPATLLLIGALLCTTSACFWKRPAPQPPTNQRIVLHGIVDFNKANIREDSTALLQEAATALREHDNLGVVVEGHSDSKGTEAYNQKLSLRRAVAVRDYLVALGVASDRILVLGKGSIEPIATNATREGRAQNRRVELRVYQEEPR